MKQTLHFRLALLFLLAFSINSFSQLWTWKKGSNTINNPAVYGSLGVSSASSTPGARYGATSWTDLTGKFWLMGGQGYSASGTGRLNDLWRYNPANDEWTWMNGSTSNAPAGIYGTMGTGASTNTPGGRAFATSWVDNSGNLWLFGGEGYDVNGTFGNLNDLWKYDISTNSWTWISGSNLLLQNGTYGLITVGASTNTPGARRAAAGWKDNSGDLFIFGGYGRAALGGDGYLADLWRYNIASNEWTWMHGTNVINQVSVFGTQGTGISTNMPGARYGHTTWKDNSGTLWMCNGYGYDGTGLGYLSDIWKYSSVTNIWTWMDGSSTINEATAVGTRGVPTNTDTPGGRHYSMNWTDPSGNLILLGGANGGQCSDLWRYNILTAQWSWIRGGNGSGVYGTKGTAAVGNDPGPGYLKSGWKDASGNFWLFGGVGSDVNGANSHLNELWKTTLASAAPAANFSFNQTAQVCMGTRIQISDLSSNVPVAWTYSLDGVAWSNAQNPFLQNSPTPTLSAGLHTVSLLVANSAGYSTPYTQTINVINSTIPTLTTTPSGSLNLYIGSGSTPNSDWAPWVFNFTDPLPAGASITRIIMTYTGVDQGFGGTGVAATMYVADQYIGGLGLLHSAQALSFDYVGPIPNYINGGVNTFKMYFWGYPGWQAHISNANLQIFYQTTTVTVCAGNTVTLTATGASTYSWTNGATNGVTHLPSASAIYTVNATAANGCITSATHAVVVNPLPTITINSGAICAGSSYTISPTGASTYTFINGSTVVSPLSTTAYSVTGTSTAGCISALAGVGNVSVNPVPTIVASSGAICIGSSFAISASGAATYTYSGGPTVSPVVNTNYSVTGTSALGCVSAVPAISSVTVNPLPVLSISGNSAVCIGSSVSQTVSGASTYTWNGATTGNVLTVSPAVNTTYTVQGTNSNGCLNTSTVMITVNTLPTITVNSGAICAGNSFTITPAGASTYTYSGGTALVTPGTTTSYSVTGFSAQGCASSPVISNVVVNPLPVPVISGTTQVCEGSSITLSVSGASTFTWSNGSTGSSVVLSPSVSTTYSVTGTSVDGCIGNAVRSIVVHARPVISVNNGTICSGNSFNIIPTGASTYTYSGGSSNVSPPVSTTYSVTGTDALGCVSASAAISNVVVNATPTISVNNGVTCAGDTFTIVPSGASTYTISGGSAVVNPVVSTSYSVSGTSAQGCVSGNIAVSALTVNPLPVPVISGTTQVCEGSSITLSVSGASTFTWSNGSTGSSVVLSPSVSTTYSVTGTSTAGCLGNAVRTITVHARPVISVNNGTICSGNSFSIIPAGASTYTYSGGSSNVSPMVNTTYSVTGTSTLGCVSAGAAISTVAVNITPTISVNSGVICAGSSFTIVPSGAQTYTLQSGTAIVSPATTTAYTVSGTSAQGCVSASAALSSVTVNPLPALVLSGPNAVCNGSAISQTVTGANTYSWNTGATTNTVNINISTPTTFVVLGTNTLSGCSSTISKLITVGSLPVITVNSGNICSGTSFTMNPGGASTYTFSNGTQTVGAVVSPTSNASYFVTGTSSLGCVSTGPAIANVIVSAPPVIGVNSGAICTGGSFTIVPSGANTYTITGGSPVVSPGITTSYSVTGTSLQGCVSAGPGVSTVTVNAIPLISVSGGTLCSGKVFTITPSGAATYTYSGGSQTVSPLVTTSYSVTGTSSAGCVGSNTAVTTVTVSQSPSVSVPGGTLCSGNVFTFSPSGAFSYSYSSGSSTVMPSTTTSYSVTGISAAGCVSTNTAVATLSVLSTPTISVNSGSICAGNSFVINPSGSSNYTITGGTATVSPVSSANYTVTGFSGGCIAIPAISSVIVNTTPVLSITGNTSICAGNSASLTVSGAGTYIWSNFSTSNVLVISPNFSTTYSVTGSNAGCLSTASVAVTVNSLPVVTVNSGTVCPAQQFVIVPAGASTYTFSGGSATVTPFVTTTYSVSGTDINGCVSQFPALSVVNVHNTTTLSVAGTSVICYGDSASITVTGAGTYTWSTGSNSGSVVISPTATTIYTVSGTTGACTDTAYILVKVNQLPVLNLAASASTICIGETAVLSASGVNTYSWSHGGTGTLTVNPVVNTMFFATGIDLNGCSNSDSLMLYVTECTGVAGKNEAVGLSLYPNPNFGQFKIETASGVHLTIRNTLGQVILEQDLAPGESHLELQHESKGMYFAEITDGKRSQVIKFIKQ